MTQLDKPGFSRREVVRAGMLIGMGTALPGYAASPESFANNAGLPLIAKAIPSTGEKIPPVGLGASQFGEGDPKIERDILRRMHEMGGALIDTAARYEGSEESIGNALKELNLRSKMFISTKFSAAGAATYDGGPPPDTVGGIESFERSLKRLHTDKLDLLMVHFLPSVDLLMPIMLDLKKAGRVRYIGITSFLPELQPRVAEYMRKYPLDFVQVDYRLNDRSAEKEIFPLARERKVAVMAAVPFGGRRDLLFRQIGDRKLPQWAAEFDAKTWGQFFLKYVISHPDVTCAIPGTNDIAHLEDNLGGGRGRVPDAAMRKRMEAFWEGKT